MKAMLEPRIVAASTQRPAGPLHGTSAFTDRMMASSHGAFMEAMDPFSRGLGSGSSRGCQGQGSHQCTDRTGLEHKTDARMPVPFGFPSVFLISYAVTPTANDFFATGPMGAGGITLI
jgi:hypothetical protein